MNSINVQPPKTFLYLPNHFWYAKIPVKCNFAHILAWQNYILLEQPVDILIKELMKISIIDITIKC